MSVHSRMVSTIEAMPAPRPLAAQIQRIEGCIATAERQIDEQEARIRQASLTGCASALDTFELQKMRLLLAILHEGRERLLQLD